MGRGRDRCEEQAVAACACARPRPCGRASFLLGRAKTPPTDTSEQAPSPHKRPSNTAKPSNKQRTCSSVLCSLQLVNARSPYVRHGKLPRCPSVKSHPLHVLVLGPGATPSGEAQHRHSSIGSQHGVYARGAAVAACRAQEPSLMSCVSCMQPLARAQVLPPGIGSLGANLGNLLRQPAATTGARVIVSSSAQDARTQ